VSKSGDQASRLRSLFHKGQGVAPQQTAQASGTKRARVIAVSSGKGGVGKTNIAANLAIAMASAGRKVALLDADYALANVDILLGFNPRLTIEHVLSGERSIGEIMIDGPGGIKIVPAASGVQNLAQLNGQQQNLLIKSLQLLEGYFDVLVLDTAAGIADEVVSVLRAAGETLVVTNPEPPAFVDSYALVKHMLSVQSDYRLRILVNQVESEQEARAVFDRISKTVVKFLKGKVEYTGYVLEDGAVKKAVRARKPFYLQYPDSRASACIQSLAYRMLKENTSQQQGFAARLKGLVAS